MEHCSTTAGYFNFSLKEKLEARYPNGELQALLRQLSAFHITLDFNMAPAKGPLPSEIVVLHNLLQRGMPTMPSLAVEKALTALGYTLEKDSETTFDFPVTEKVNDVLLDEIFTALHVVDNRFEPDYKGILESKFEEDVFLRSTRAHPFLRQLLTPQVPLSELMPGRTGFREQRTDFSIPLVYPIDAKEAGESVVKGYILEVDGKPYHSSFKQKMLDQSRDSATTKAGWSTQRISEKGHALHAFGEIVQQPYVAQVAKCYQRAFDAHWIKVLQLTLTPFAVARVQKVVLDAILSGHLNVNEEKWEIVVIERDVPCAGLAMEDLNEWLKNIFNLSGRTEIPKIILKKVFASQEFARAELRGNEALVIGEYDGTACDLVVDVSMLRRYGMELNLTYPYPFAIVRTERWPWVDRRFYTAKPIAYGEFAKLEKDRWTPTDRAEGLTWFLQNIFRKKAFRPGQIGILNRALNQKTVIGLLPTGGGKSLTYQLAALLQPGFALVIDPLRSLMRDQVDNLKKNGIDACGLVNSTQTIAEKQYALYQLRTGQTMIFFVSPERMMMEEFRKVLDDMRRRYGFSYCVIDEVHCVSEWGHDFRPAYLALGRNAVEHLPYAIEGKTIPLFGLTATASYDVLADVERELLLQDEPEAIVSAEYTSRDELLYQVLEVHVQYETYEFQVDDTKQKLFKVHPVKMQNASSLNANVAEAKLVLLNHLIQRIPEFYDDLNHSAEISPVLERTWDEILDSDLRDTYSKDKWIAEKSEKICYPKYQTDTLFKDNGGLIFAPHRSSIFGVSDKFKRQIDANGRPLSGSNKSPVFIDPKSRRGIADRIQSAQFSGAIPYDFKEGDFPDRFIGTFIGSSDEAQNISALTDKDSFRNQELFITDKLKLMVATKAFGMGIDKQNIRFTVHFNSPASPESFVQEAGRAGRDGHLALSYVLINRQKLYSLRKSHFRLLRREGYVIPQIDNRIEGKYFQEQDFRALLGHMQLPALEDLRRWPWERDCQVPFEESNIDEDILNFFHGSSYRGVDIEQWYLNSILFESITFPGEQLKEVWEKQLEEALGFKVKLNYWEQGARIYIKEADETELSLGYIDINGGWVSKEGNDRAYTAHDALKALIYAHNGNKFPDAITFKAQFYFSHGEKQLPGVLEFLETKNEQKFLIGFNNYFHAGGQKSELLACIRNHFDDRYDEKTHSLNYDKAVAGSLSFEAYFESLFRETDQWIDTPEYLDLKRIWFSKRSKSDTDKAIYRLTCIGIVDDFEVDYRNKVYHLDIQPKSPGDYVMALYTYLRRYYSDKRVRRLLEEHLDSVELPFDSQSFANSLITLKTGRNLKSLFKELVTFIVSFAYQEIAAKRKAAIRDIFSAYDEYLNNESDQTGSGNFKLKSYLHLYFNSKYAREEYKAKLEDPDAQVDYSLRDDTQNGNVLSFERVLEYIQLMSVDLSGNETDNIKHLRGASTRLLRSDTKNPSLRLLKAFSLFVLAWQFDAPFQEACDDCEEGLMDFVSSSDDQESLAMVNAYTEAVSVYLPRTGAEKVEEYFREMRNTLILRRNLQWLKGFNQRFLKDFKPQS